ncbi:MAG: hypothetical protein IKJ22_01115 [Paludibacteraceae bacterium]|nr:hypothetical protein [Paludibacteraceae bacterium]
MKYRNLILSVLFWAIASVSFALTLPSSSYSSFSDLGNEEYTLDIGTKFFNTALLSTYEPGTCVVDKQDPKALQLCQDCCIGAVLANGGSEQDYGVCMSDCFGYSLPLGSPLLLLPFALVYAVIRRKHKVTE